MYMNYRRCGFKRYKYHRRDLHWPDRIYLRHENDFDYNVDYQEGWYSEPEDSLPPVQVYKYIKWPPRKAWWRACYAEKDFATFLKYVEAEEEWIVVEPFMVGDKCGRWIEVGNSFHKTAAWAPVFSMVICYLYPNKKWLYWSLNFIAFYSAWAYHDFMKDPINKYQVVTNLRQLSQFPMKTFISTPMVFHKTPNIRRRICHRILVAVGFLFSLCFLPSHPPCGCAPGADVMVDVLPPRFWSYWSDVEWTNFKFFTPPIDPIPIPTPTEN